MKAEYRIIVEDGPDKGREFPVSDRATDIGRNATDGIILNDPELSRRHCRVEFRGDELWIVDLASTNGTFLNGRELGIDGSRLGAGDTVSIGATTLRVRGPDATTPAAAEPVAAAPAAVDLGFRKDISAEAAATSEARTKRSLLWAVAVVFLLVVVALAVKKILEPPVDAPTARIQTVAAPKTLAIRYTKLEGDTDNVFRYDLSVETNGAIAVVIDDLAQQRHVRRESDRPADPKLLANLARAIEQSGFFGLSELYEGISPANRENDYDIVVVSGRDVRRVRVRNRAEPEEFRDAREKIETFVRNELGLWAIEFSTEQLRQMALDALLVGQRLHQERDIQPGNLHEAIKSFRECENLLETVEPKPDFFDDARNDRRECERLLDERYKERNFAADRAIKLKDWPVAAEELRALLLLVPDRADERNRDAERRLLDVENRLRKK